MTPRIALAAALLAGLTAPTAPAAFLTPAYESRLESWLGEGNLTFTNIFTSTVGDGQEGIDFHAAVDGRGRTFTLLKVFNAYNAYSGQPIVGEFIIGGYNPQSWNSSTSYNYTYNNADRTAFLFNLTTDQLRRQNLSTDPNSGGGESQTVNYANLGPTFGAGWDMYVGDSLNQGTAYNYSYGGTVSNNNVFSQQYTVFQIAGVEVYSVSPDSTVATPEPGSLAMLGSGVVMLIGVVRAVRRKKDTDTPAVR